MDDSKVKELLNKEDTSIFRYRTFNEYALTELANSKLYFSSLDSFNDPFEVSSLVNSGIDRLSTEELRADIHHKGYACFCCSNVNLHMWAHYADGLRGMCFVYDAVELYKSLIKLNPSLYQFDFQKVEYLDKINSINGIIKNDSLDISEKSRKLSLATTSSKIKDFECENEARIMIGRLNYDDIGMCEDSTSFNPDGSVHSREIEFSENSLKAVILGEKMKASYRSIVERLIATRNVVLQEAVRLPVTNGNIKNALVIRDL
jgi:hypothetical protein